MELLKSLGLITGFMMFISVATLAFIIILGKLCEYTHNKINKNESTTYAIVTFLFGLIGVILMEVCR